MQLVEQRSISRKSLYDQVWSTPMSKLCQQYGLSDNGLRKICKRFDIPMPMRGHWAKLQHGKRVRQTALPPSEYAEEDEILVVTGDADAHSAPSSVDIAAQREKKRENRIQVPPELIDPLPVIERTRKSLLSAKPDEDGLAKPRAQRCLDISVSHKHAERAMLIADTLLKALEARGIEVVADTESGSIARIDLEGDSVGIALAEQLDRQERPLSSNEKREKKSWPWMYDKPLYTYSPSGRLTLCIEGGKGRRCQRYWRDTDRRRLENSLNAFISGIHRVADANRIERKEDERLQRKWAEDRRLREEEERRHHDEKMLIDELDQKLVRWRKCEDIRALCTAFEVRADALDVVVNEGSELDRWLTWARQRADALDPVQFA